MKHHSIILAKASFFAAAVLSLGAVSQSASAATIPYTNDFSGSGSNVDLFESPTNSYTLSGGTYNSTHSNTGAAQVSGATIDLTNANDVSFTMEMQFNFSAIGTNSNGTANTMGFSFLGDTAGNTSGTYYFASIAYSSVGVSSGVNLNGTLNMVTVGAPPVVNNLTSVVTGFADDNAGSGTLAVQLNTTYRLRLQGSYISGTDDLNLSLSLWNAAGTTQIGSSATGVALDALAGQNFGLRNRTFQASGSTTVAYDNFSVVPEPGMLGYTIFGLGAMLLMRRQRGCSV